MAEGIAAIASSFSLDAQHSAAVASVAAAVRARPAALPLSVAKATRSHTPHVKHYKRRGHAVDVSALTRVLRGSRELRCSVCYLRYSYKSQKYKY